MKPLLLAAAVLLSGCLYSPPAPPGPKPDADPSPAPVASKIPAKQFFADLADWVEGDEATSTQQVLKVAARSMHTLGISVPTNYDTIMQPYLANKPLDPVLKKKLANDLRGFAK